MINRIREWLQGRKTYLLGLIGILTGIAEMFGIDVVPEVDESNALNYIWASLGMMTIRAGIGNNKPPASDGMNSGV